MRSKDIDQLKLQCKTSDEIYDAGICSYSLFGQAFFGFKSSKTEKQKMNRLWARILLTGKLNAKTSPHSSGKYL